MEKEIAEATEPETGTPEYSKHLVREVMNEIIRRIDDGMISAERISELHSALKTWLSGDGVGLQPIQAGYWREMHLISQLADIGFDEMVQEALDEYWESNLLNDYSRWV